MLTRDEVDRLWVIGVIDAYGAVHSEGFNWDEDDVPMHGDLYPHIVHKKWRWTADGIQKSGDWTDSNVEEFDRMVRHISKKYKVKLNIHGISEYHCY